MVKIQMGASSSLHVPSAISWMGNVVFGRVIDGLLVMRKIENVPTGPNNKPKIPVVISQCGQM